MSVEEAPISLATAQAPVAPLIPAEEGEPPRQQVGLLPVLTLVLWVFCLAVGILGLVLQPPPPAPPKPPEPPPIHAELMKVDLIQEPAPLPPPEAAAQPSEFPPELSAPQEAPPLAEVAQLTPAIAFALPIEGPVRIVAAQQAGFARPVQKAAPVKRLIFGQGAGKQPEPEYPSEAINARQQGVVGITLTIDEDGRLRSAQISSPSRFPLLNQAALDVVRQRWPSPPGSIPPGRWSVNIGFHINER